MEYYDRVNYYITGYKYDPEPCRIHRVRCALCKRLMVPEDNDLPDLCNECFRELTHCQADDIEKASNY